MKRNWIRRFAAGTAVLFALQSSGLIAFAEETEALRRNLHVNTALEGGSTSTPSDAQDSKVPGWKEISIEDLDVTVTLSRRGGSGITREGEAPVSEEANILSFDFQRQHSPSNPDTYNDLINPGLIHVTITMGQDLGPGKAKLKVSPAIADKISITNQKLDLGAGKKLEFDVQFTDLTALTGNFDLTKQMEENLISVCLPDDREMIVLHVLYSAVGKYDFYSAQYYKLYDGKYIKDSSGVTYASVGEIDLSDYDTATLSVIHTYYKVKTVESRIDRTELYPEGDYTFLDGSYKQKTKVVGHGEKIDTGIKMKSSVFKKLKAEADRKKRDVDVYYVISDLRYYYTDGFEVGGRMDTVPLVVHVVYDYEAPSTGGSGGGSGGGGGGGGSSSGPAVHKPAAEARTPVVMSKQNDIGWTLSNGIWYYLNASGSKVVGWLQTRDAKWYYLDAEGKMKVGWVLADKVWYYMNVNGSMATGWVWLNNSWYYLNQNGSMAASTRTPDGYYVGSNGAWTGR